MVFFIRKRASAALPSTAAYWYMDDGTTDLFNAIYLGVGLEGGADAGRLGVIFYSPTGATDFRHVYASDQQFTANDTWQCAVYTFDGVSAPKIYTNGVLGTNAQTTGGGSPPAATRWMASNSFPRCVLYTRQYNAPAGTLNSKVSNPFIINGVVLTQAQITNIMSYLPTP